METVSEIRKKAGKATFLKNNRTDEFTANCRVQKLIAWAEGRGWDLRGKRNEWLTCIVSMLVSGAHQKLTVGDLQQFNQMLIEPLPEEELAAILKTMGVYPYPMKNDTIAKHLGMTDEEFVTLTTSSLSGGGGKTRTQNKTRDAIRAKNKAEKQEKYEKIPQLIAEGKTLKEIAEILDISERTVKAKSNGKERKAELYEQIAILKAQGLTQKEVAAKLRTSRSTVKRHWK